MDLRDLKCSFCEARIDKDTGTLGADVGICHSCANRAADRLAAGFLSVDQSSAWSRSEECRCDFCYTSTAESSTLFTNRGHFVCAKCVALIRNQIIGKPISEAQTNANGVFPL